jgi:hypothetical protein
MIGASGNTGKRVAEARLSTMRISAKRRERRFFEDRLEFTLGPINLPRERWQELAGLDKDKLKFPRHTSHQVFRKGK